MTSIEARKQLLYALRRVLRPIVRLLIRAGVRFDEFADLARGVYVESAIRDGTNNYFGTPTRERIAVVAGSPATRLTTTLIMKVPCLRRTRPWPQFCLRSSKNGTRTRNM